MYYSILFVLFLSVSFTSSVFCTKPDEIVLLKLKKQLGNPDSLSWWVKGFDYCDWWAHFDDPYSYMYCTSTGRVSTLRLHDLVVSTSFPDEICCLTELENLYIERIPGLYGSIPSCISKLPKLRTLVIDNTSLSGPIPSFYNHPNIEHIVLAHSHLSGSIPASLSTCPNLDTINLMSNYLTGTIPPGLANGSSPSSELRLTNNNLTGELPKSYGDFPTLVLGNNRLSGDASFLFRKKFKTAMLIDLNNNDFEFDLSQAEFSDYLVWLDLSHNKIYGKVPESFATAKLQYPNLSFNRLCGELPQGGNMWQYRADAFSNNACLCGKPLPPCNISTPAPAPVPLA